MSHCDLSHDSALTDSGRRENGDHTALNALIAAALAENHTSGTARPEAIMFTGKIGSKGWHPRSTEMISCTT